MQAARGRFPRRARAAGRWRSEAVTLWSPKRCPTPSTMSSAVSIESDASSWDHVTSRSSCIYFGTRGNRWWRAWHEWINCCDDPSGEKRKYCGEPQDIKITTIASDLLIIQISPTNISSSFRVNPKEDFFFFRFKQTKRDVGPSSSAARRVACSVNLSIVSSRREQEEKKWEMKNASNSFL